MSISSQIDTPSIENLPMIDRAFAELRRQHREDKWQADIWPDVVGDDLTKAFDAIDPTVMADLFKSMQPTVRGKLIQSHHDLAGFTQFSREQFLDEWEDEDLCEYSDKHLQMYLLQRAIYPDLIDWRAVTDVVNACSAEQKGAIDQFFFEFHRIEVERLLTTKSMALAVPSSLYSKNEVRQDGDEIFVLCKVANTWMRDVEFYRQFEVSALDEVTGDHGIVGYAGTLEQAMAKATLFALSKHQSATNQIDPFGKLNVAGGRPLTLRLRRRHSLIGIADLKNLNTPIPCSLEWSLVKNGAIDEKVIRSALYAAEKAMGVQWSKARDLEAAMGL